MKAKDFNIFKILEKTYNKMVYPFQTSGEFKDLPKTIIRQTEEKIPLASNVVDFIEERRKIYLNRGVKIVRSRSS